MKSLSWLFLISLVLRIVFSLFLDFEGDQAQVFAQGARFFLNREISTQGAAIVYTGTALPGSLQSLLAGIPLFISSGMPWGAAVFVGLLNSFALWAILLLVLKSFRDADQFTLRLIVFFAPWTLLFNGLWNPSYLPVFSSLFFLGMVRVFEKPQDFVGAVCISFGIVAALQLHLSFVILPMALAMMVLLRWMRFPRWKGLLTGAVAGGLTLIPYFLEKMQAAQAAPVVSSRSFFFQNLEIHWDHLKQWPAFFLRFLSFPTGETTRFIGKFSGFGGTLRFFIEYPIFIPFGVLSLVCSVFMIFLGVRFYFRSENWKLILKGPSDSTNSRQFLTVLTLLVPILTGFLFAFSVTGPSAHTFWILLPLSFFPVLSELARKGWVSSTRIQLRPVWVGYTFIAVVFSLGSFLAVDRVSLIRTQDYASQVARGERAEDSIPLEYRPFVRLVSKTIQQNLLNP